MNTFENLVRSKLHSYIDSHNDSIFKQKFILSLSGGVDSIALFNCLNDMELYFYTIHFNHNYHSKASEVSIFLYDLANSKASRISLFVENPIARNSKVAGNFRRRSMIA